MAWFLLLSDGVKGLTAALLLIAASISSAANISIQGAYASDSSGNPIQVRLGESFYMTAQLNVDAPLAGSYRLRFDLPYASRTTPDLTYGGQAHVTWGPYDAMLDQIPVTVTVDSSSDKAGSTLTVPITPVQPGQAIEYYAPQRLSGTMSATAFLTAGTAAGLQWFSPLPASGGFQQVLTTIKQGSLVTSTPFGQPVATLQKAVSVSLQFETTASSSRVNSGLLRQTKFAAYNILPATIKPWLKAETLVESANGDVTKFVATVLPKNFKQTMAPYDAVQNLFQAVVGHVQYTVSTARPDALAALRTGRGDCGFFSALFVACCRNIGVPARTVSGMTMGATQWHTWTEFYVPNAGWIPADPSFCDSICPDGSLPLYFGTVPDLNSRVATTYGLDHVASGKSMPILQSPAVFQSGATRVASVQSICSLSLANSN